MPDTAALKALHAALIDAYEGYKDAHKDAEESGMRFLFQHMVGVHTQAHDEVHRTLVERGETLDDVERLTQAAPRQDPTFRSIIEKLERESLAAFATGEDMIVGRYDEAIEENADDKSLVDLLVRQRDALAKLIGEMRSAVA